MTAPVMRRSEPTAASRRERVLVSTAWVAERADDAGIRVVEVDVDTSAYDQGHVPGAIGWNWSTQLCDRRVRDIVGKEEYEALMRASGIERDTTVVLYGDNSNWFAAWAFWQLAIYQHADVRIMDGGRKKWIDEARPLTLAAPAVQMTDYVASEPDWSIRALRTDVERVLEHVSSGTVLIDVRSPQEFSGELLAPPGLAETCQRGGHIPSAVNVPWARACNEDGTFRRDEELLTLYGALGVIPEKDVITYCRIGERSSHSWFVLTHLLGFPRVRNYDGSWTEWGNLVAAPVETGAR
jgi:thiosulfate/3-mercaptopyruvate sulfurtransferase